MLSTSFQQINPNQALRFIIINSKNAQKFIDGMTKLSNYSFNTINKYFSKNNSQFNPNFNSLQKICNYCEINLLDFIFLSQQKNLLTDFSFNNPQNFITFCKSSLEFESLNIFLQTPTFSIGLEEIINFLSETRKRKNLTEETVANRLKVKKQRISQIENHYKIENSYKLKTIASYSNAIELPLEEAIIESITSKRLHLHS